VNADFAVVGAGFSGLAAAYFLRRAEPRARIVVLDAGRVGCGASGRSAGLVSPEFNVSLKATARAHGKQRAREAFRYMEHAVEVVEQLVMHNRIACGYRRAGMLRIATAPAHERRLHEEMDLANRMRIGSAQWLSPAAVKARVDGPRFCGATWEPRAAQVDPFALALGLKAVLQQAGVQFFECCPVVRLEKRIGRLFARTPKGGVLAEKVAITTNAYSRRFGGLRGKQVPLTMHAMASEPIPAERLDALGWREREAISDARRFGTFYLLTPDARLVVGSREAGLLAALGRGARSTFERLERDVAAMFPSLGELRFPHRWSGPVSATFELEPALGYLGSKRMVYSLGCMGRGIALAHLNGWTMADLLLEERTERTEVFFVNRTVIPWPPGPLQLVLAAAMRALMMVEDAWHERPRCAQLWRGRKQ